MLFPRDVVLLCSDGLTRMLTEPEIAGTLQAETNAEHAAARLIQLVEDSFDLCRYYNILVESPNTKACAYKEMGKCPAPCDGTIPMSQYHQMIEQSVTAIVSPGNFIDRQTRQMNEAAAARQSHLEPLSTPA